MAVQLIENDGVRYQSLEDFRIWASEQKGTSYRKNNQQIDIMDVKDGDRISVVVKASGN